MTVRATRLIAYAAPAAVVSTSPPAMIAVTASAFPIPPDLFSLAMPASVPARPAGRPQDFPRRRALPSRTGKGF
jgi:hypothetical protein